MKGQNLEAKAALVKIFGHWRQNLYDIHVFWVSL